MPKPTDVIDFRSLFAHSPNPYMVLDRELRYVAANAAYLRETQSRLEDLIGRPILDVFPHDASDPNNESASQLRASFERVLATGAPDVLALIPYRIPREHDGRVTLELRYWSATHTPIVDDAGEVAFILQHTVDVTELHALKEATALGRAPADDGASSQVEAAILGRAQRVQEANRTLDAERRHLRSLFAQAPGFMSFLRGPDHVFELANDAYYQVVGHRDILGKPLREALPELEGQGFLELLDRVFATGEPFVGRSMSALLQQTPGGPLSQVFIDFVYQPIVDPTGVVTGIFVQGHDITDRKRLEAERTALLAREQAARAEAERANMLKDDFLATVSHELRTPLTAMLGWVRLLRGGRLPEDRHARALETIERNARAQAQLIEDLLDVSRIMSGKLQLQVEALDVAAVVEAALESIRPAADARGVLLKADLATDSRAMGDPARLQQVVWNLLSNAVKFTPRDGVVKVVTVHREGALEITVTDTGQGIGPDFLPFVFERFRQGEGSAVRQHGGLGLGLAIVKHLVELHGGTIRAASDGEGRGASFTVSLPVAGRRADAAVTPFRREASADLECPPELAGLRLLVVDDEADTRELLQEILERCGTSVTTATCASDGLEAVRATRPDMILTDIGMPGEDGYSLLQRVRALPPDEGGRTPAIALTAYARSEDRTRALLAGFKAHVPKPIDPEELLAVLVSVRPPMAAR